MTPPSDSGNLKLAGKVLGGALAVVLLALFAFNRFFGAPAEAERSPEVPLAAADAGAAPAAAPVEGDGEAVVAAIQGRVERSIAGGAWAELRAGERLRANDAIRTGVNSRAELEVDDHSSVAIAASSEIGIREVRRAAHTFKLVRGQVAVDYQPDGTRTLRIESEGGHAIARTEGARFSVLSSGGSLAVATDTGTVNLEAAGKEVAVGAGQQSIARADSAPSVAAPIPVKLLLKLAANGKAGCPTVRGVAEPGTEVLVDGAPIALEPDGRFTVKPPADGRKALVVMTRHVSGRTEEKSFPCKAPEKSKVDLSIRWKKQTR